MARDKAAKVQLADQYTEKLTKANAAFVAEYRGLTVAELTELRRELRKKEGEFQITKNRVVKKAISGGVEDAEALDDLLKGPIGVVYVYGDVAASAKAVLNFSKDHEKFKLSGGVMDGRKIGLDELKALSDLPSKEVLLSKIVGSLVAPHRGLLGILTGVPRNVVSVINAIKDKKES